MEKQAAVAFELLWHREYPGIVRTAYLMTGSREDAADLAQDAFAVAWRRWEKVGTLDRPGAWVQVTVGKLALNWRRRRRIYQSTRQPGYIIGEPELADPQLTRALRELPPAQRTVVVLRFYADQSVDQVAQGLGKRPGTVRALTSQAMTTLRAVLNDSEVINDAR
jgi:RNA polymerase sigma factor (sigma-70 family)